MKFYIEDKYWRGILGKSVIEISTLEELLKFSKEVDRPLLIQKNYDPELPEWEIEIFSGYSQ